MRGGALGTLTSTFTSSSTNTTTFTVADSTYFAIGDILRIDNELMLVTAVSVTGITVLGGQLGTNAGTHAANAVIVLAIDERGIIRSGIDMGSYAANVDPPLPGGATVATSKVAASGIVDDIDSFGNLYIWSGPGVTWKQIDSSVYSIVFTGNGDLVDRHLGGGLYDFMANSPNYVQLDSSVKAFAVAGNNGDLVDLRSNGGLYQFTATGSGNVISSARTSSTGMTPSSLDGGVSGFYSTAYGDLVDYHASGAVYSITPYTSSGGTPTYAQIDGGVTNIVKAGNGDVVDLHVSRALYEITNDKTGASILIGSGVAQVATAGNGDVVELNSATDLIEFTSFRSGTAYVQLDNGVLGFVIAGNGDVVDRRTNNTLIEFTSYRSSASYIQIDSNVLGMAIASNGDVVDLRTNGALVEFTAFRSTANVQIDGGVTYFQISGNGTSDVVDLHANGDLYQFTNYRSPSSCEQIDGGVNDFKIASNGLVEDHHYSGLYYIQAVYRGFVSQPISQYV